jgi:NAD(P)-dependent dehydrogenase (short-subunit alcohol dehydrogenase family)
VNQDLGSARQQEGTKLSIDAVGVRVDLTGQVALVTGGSEGLGRAFALALARAGAQVAVTARRPELLTETTDLIERLGGRGLAVPGDVTVPDAVAEVVRTAESRLGPIDILVNNAGALGPLGYDWQVDPEEWRRTFEVNVLGAFRYAREVLVGMMKRKRGRIVNITSGAGFSRLPQMSAYCVTKAVDAVDEDPGGRYTRARSRGLRPSSWHGPHADAGAACHIAGRTEAGG